MWAWLNDNSGAMQAIASVASVAVTVVLVIITARYVRLTKGLAEAATADLAGKLEASKARRRELASQIGVLRSALDSLPNRKNWNQADAVMRNSIGWENFDFGVFRRLASEVTDSAASCAATVESKMQRMAELVNPVKSTPKAYGYAWSSFPQKEWLDSLLATREALASILAELSLKP